MDLNHKRSRHNLLLFILCFIYVFVLGLFEGFFKDFEYVYSVVMTLILIACIFSVQDTARGRFLYLPLIMVILAWVSEFLKFQVIEIIALGATVLYFAYIIVFLVYRVASSKEVGPLEFLESINVYLLLGIAASALFAFIYSENPQAYNPPGEVLNSRADFIYYSFVTLTTLGYGDITPIDSLSRSVSIFFSVVGQLYLTMIIAMLVGKYLNNKNITE